MHFVEGQAWSSWKGMVDGIEGETGWSWFHVCTSMITPTVYKNVQIPFGPRGFRRMVADLLISHTINRKSRNVYPTTHQPQPHMIII